MEIRNHEPSPKPHLLALRCFVPLLHSFGIQRPSVSCQFHAHWRGDSLRPTRGCWSTMRMCMLPLQKSLTMVQQWIATRCGDYWFGSSLETWDLIEGHQFLLFPWDLIGILCVSCFLVLEALHIYTFENWRHWLLEPEMKISESYLQSTSSFLGVCILCFLCFFFSGNGGQGHIAWHELKNSWSTSTWRDDKSQPLSILRFVTAEPRRSWENMGFLPSDGGG